MLFKMICMTWTYLYRWENMKLSLKEELFKEKEKQIKKTGNKFLFKFIIIFIVGYTIFFSSKLWMPTTYTGVEITKVGTTIEKNKRRITVASWEYSKEEETFEIITEIDNFSIDGIDKYVWEVLGKGKKYKIKVKQSNNFYIITVKDVKSDWSEVSLNIDISDKDKGKNSEFEPIKIYMNDRNVKYVSKITTHTGLEYQIKAYENEIEIVDSDIEKLNKDKYRINEKIEEAERKIKELNSGDGNLGIADKTELNDKIENINTDKENLKGQISEKDEQIKKLKKKKNFLKQKLEELREN